MSTDNPILKGRQFRLKGPLPPEDLFLLRMEMREALSEPYEIEVLCISNDHKIVFDKVVGRAMAIEVDCEKDKKRYFHGHCVRFGYEGAFEGFGLYRAILRPWFWFLTQTSDCRVFQEKSTVDIIKEILGEHGFSDYRSGLSKTYSKRTYCVQYNETDFDFISRLMEEDGMYYFFEHEEKKNTLVLCDDRGVHKAVKDNPKIEFYVAEDRYRRRNDHIFYWKSREGLQTGKMRLTDYDFEKPTADLKAENAVQKGTHSHKGYEVYSYPGRYLEVSDGDRLSRVRIQATAADHVRAEGSGNVRPMKVGDTFDLSRHKSRPDQEKEYLIVRARHRVSVEGESPDSTDVERAAYDEMKPALERLTTLLDPLSLGMEEPTRDSFRCDFEVQLAKDPFKAKPLAPKPKIAGLQTAVVVGPKGDEIYTDKYGRIKVQFHWDREGKKDDKSSCWVRCAQLMAGPKWGMIYIPRIGQEVVVQFEEGDPDRPLVTGVVYNATNMPPYALPANMTQMGFKSDTSKGGGGFNEFVMEDKKDAEFVRLQSEKDYKETIKNNADIAIGFEKKDAGDLTHKVYNHRTEEVDQGDYKRTIKTGSEIIDIATDRTMTIGSNETRDVGSDFTENIGSNSTIDVGSELSITAGSKITLKVGGSTIVMDASSIKLKSTQIEVAANATLKLSGSASADLSSDGMCNVSAAMVDIAADGMLTAAGPMVDIAGDGMLMLGGGLVMIN